MTTPTPASFTTGAGPFALTNGGTLLILGNSANQLVEPTYSPIAGGDDVFVTFAAKDVGNIAAVLPQELADIINAAAVRQAAAGAGPSMVAAVVGETVTVMSTVAMASNGGAGQILQVLPQSTELASLGVEANLYYPTPYPAFDPPISL